MRFKICQKDLIEALTNLVRITSKTQPDIYIKPAEDNYLILSSTNARLILTYKIKADEISGEEISIEAKKFYEIVSRLDGLIEFDNGIIKNKKRKITIGVKSENLVKLFDVLNNKQSIVIDLEDFKKVVKKRLFACSKQEYAEALKSVFINNNEIITCNSNLLSLGKLKEPIDSILLSQETVNEIIKIFKSDKIYFINENNKLIFYNDITTLIGYKVNANYPKYEQLLPKYSTKKIKLPKAEILKNLELMLIVADKEKPNVRLIFNENKLKLVNSVNNEDVIEVDIDYKGEKREIAFNINYLIDIFKNTDEDNEIQFINSSSSAVFTTSEDYNLLMPVLIK